jgi:hypothetical protein
MASVAPVKEDISNVLRYNLKFPGSQSHVQFPRVERLLKDDPSFHCPQSFRILYEY